MAEHAVNVTINAKDEATKQIKAIDKQLAALTKQKATVSVDLTTDEAQKQLADVSAQIDKLKGEKAAIVVETNVTKALSALDDITVEAKKSVEAAEALSKALGPDLARGADIDAIVSDFKRMDLSLDDIIANADRLGGKLREVGDGVGGGNLDNALRKSRQGVDDLGRSASSSKSVLANMVGNATQDLGQMAGIAGSAGVAIGQMGEYMVDAAADGDKLGQIIGNFATVAGPIAALSIGVGLVTKSLQAAAEEQKRVAENSKKIAEDIAAGFEEIKSAADLGLEGPIDLLDDLALGFVKTQDTSGLTIKRLVELGFAVDDLGAVLKQVNTEEGFTAWAADFLKTSPKVIGLTGQMADQIAGFIAKGEDFNDVVNLATSEADQATIDWIKSNKTLLDQLEQINDAGDDFDLDDTIKTTTQRLLKSKGGLDAYLQSLRDLGPGASSFDILNHALDIYNAKLRETEETTKRFARTGSDLEAWADRTTTAIEEAAQAADDAKAAFIDIADARSALTEMSNVFNVMKRNAEGLGLAFDLKNAPLDALGEVKDFQEGLRDLVEFINDPKGLKGKIPNIFNPNDVNAAPMLSKISGMRDDVQKAITDAFATGGAAKAQATANAYVKQFVDSLHGKITAGQIETLWGLDDLEATIKIGVDQASLAAAREMLEIITGLQGGETPWTATIKLALNAGTLSADAAKILEAQRLTEMKIPVPVELLPPPGKDITAAKAAADRFAAQNNNKVAMQSILDDPTVQAVTDARKGGQTIADTLPPITFKAVVAAPTVRRFDAGGTAGGAGGIAGERGPEIINRRYLTEGPTYVPPGTRVTSRRRTALILRTRGAGGLRRYDSGGTVPSGSTIVNFNGVGAVGNRYDLMRTIHRANLDKIRLRGTRG